MKLSLITLALLGGTGALASASQSDTQHMPPVGKAAIIEVELTAQQLANKKVAQAIKALNNNDAPLAEHLFEEALILSPNQVNARKQLAALWFGKDAVESAVNLLKQGLILRPHNQEFRLMLARILTKVQQPNQAFNLLLSSPHNDNSEYLQALAHLAVETEHYVDAIYSYKKLLQLKPRQSQWWLGLAIALDKNGQLDEARMAYQSAIDNGKLSIGSSQFVQQRLSDLED
ncbi:tetratricopeptide repeat protein [Thalassotalea aquiviva]|uniref:tetratricopeptide repeat protein n=1 Tax=Thalassotalea aquiviva TaxID=3242415 RepID=UPI00352B3ECC